MSEDRPSAAREWLIAGPAHRPRRPYRRLAWGAATLTAVLGGTAILVGRAPSDAPSAREPAGTRSLPPNSGPRVAPTAAGVRMTRFPPRLLGIRQGWELYGRGDSELVRLQFAVGRMTRTRVPVLQAAGPVSFVVTGGAAVVRPLGPTPGYSVRDVRRSRPLTDPRLQSGLVLRGPRSDEVWAVRFAEDVARASLIRLRYYRDEGPVVVFDAKELGAIAPDGIGGLVARTAGPTVAYRAVPDGPGRYRGTSRQVVPPGTLVAAGANTWVLADCAGPRCLPRIVDRGSGRARTVGLAVDKSWLSGSVSPDGRSLAVGFDDFTFLMVLDLVAEKRHVLPLRLAADADLSTLAWAPDGRRLFVTDRHGDLWVFEPRRGRLRQLDLDLPPLRQLAIEP